jgi:phage recombination protein Bet
MAQKKEKESISPEMQMSKIADEYRKQIADISDKDFAVFKAQVVQTGLNPFMRQIYAIPRKRKIGNEWIITYQTLISIDGFRTIAERTGKYTGQTPMYWSDDGVSWVEGWAKNTPPKLAKVGVCRSYPNGVDKPTWAVAKYDGYVVKNKVIDKVTNKVTERPSGQWLNNPELMLSKVAEMLAFRKAFPEVLSGIYGVDEMDKVLADEKSITNVSNPIKQENSENNFDLVNRVKDVLSNVVKPNTPIEKQRYVCRVLGKDNIKSLSSLSKDELNIVLVNAIKSANDKQTPKDDGLEKDLLDAVVVALRDIGDFSEQQTYVKALLKREVKTLAELTPKEADTVIKAVENERKGD